MTMEPVPTVIPLPPVVMVTEIMLFANVPNTIEVLWQVCELHVHVHVHAAFKHSTYISIVHVHMYMYIYSLIFMTNHN